MSTHAILVSIVFASVACGGKTPLRQDRDAPSDGTGGAAPSDGGAPGEGGSPSAGGSPGDGGTASGGGSPIPIPPICTEYCEAAALKGCPKAPGCEVSCALMYPGECQDELAAYLSCAPAVTIATCEIAYSADGPAQACLAANDDLLSCGSCNSGETTSLGDDGCVAHHSCGLTTTCALDGTCNCEINGFWVGICSAIIGGIEACAPNTSCCRGFL